MCSVSSRDHGSRKKRRHISLGLNGFFHLIQIARGDQKEQCVMEGTKVDCYVNAEYER